jgi:hypothetical protein
MGQTQALAIQDLFKSLGLMKSKVRPLCFAASFEIYGPKVQDLLNNRERLEVLEDEKGRIEIVGLAKVPVQSADDLAGLLEEASAMRTTQKTDANDASSRSHSITSASSLWSIWPAVSADRTRSRTTGSFVPRERKSTRWEGILRGGCIFRFVSFRFISFTFQALS